MTEPAAPATAFSPIRQRLRPGLLPPGHVLGLSLAVLLIVVTVMVSFRALQASSAAAERVSDAQTANERLGTLLSSVKDAETGQRGFLLTGIEGYLDPYRSARLAIAVELKELQQDATTPARQARVQELQRLATDKLAELDQTIQLHRAGQPAAALDVVRSDRGKVFMDRFRALVDEMQREERAALTRLQAERDTADHYTFQVVAASGAGLLLLTLIVGFLLARGHRERETEAWLRAGVASMSARLIGEPRLEAMAGKALSDLADMLDAAVGTLYVAQDDGVLKRVAGYADAPPEAGAGDAEGRLRLGDGLVGQAAREQRMLHAADLPPNYMRLRSSLGTSWLRELLVVPAAHEGRLEAVFELGFLRPVRATDHELLKRAAGVIALAARSYRERERIEQLLVETQRQAQEMQVQQEELRVVNEELEEQGRALKASQSQLEEQQAELEQTNAHLEEQSNRLEEHAEALGRSQADLTAKAQELERSNQVKSEFLANMSHELRTPLNSTLILAKLLADNREGNLTEEQVKFARTIGSAGKDLLALINDVLDLAKIEAGKVELRLAPIELQRLVESVTRGFEAQAQHQGLDFGAELASDLPASLHTDEQRLAQILRNLLSNALKFTDAGQVKLAVRALSGDRIAFAVRDSGIGIDASQHAAVFEAFRQADGSMHRRHGGTGLGLSISRDLAQLMGGDITLESEPGKGSTFTLVVPRVITPGAAAAAAVPSVTAPVVSAPRVQTQAVSAPALADDRDRLSSAQRLILVIEDDPHFATILHDLAHEQGFQCVVAMNADDGCACALRYLPSAIVLDMNLPDRSGLTVLDQLKRDARTRHIPVHVASVADYQQAARSRGAIGYDFKPVQREQLVQAFAALRDRFERELKRVLIVEDDARQLDSIRHLLSAEGVQIVGVGRASEALDALRTTTFDCMVMDLNLPDMSGYELLERMAAEDGVSHPPVIVYTGRVLSCDEEQRLARHSESIIVKDVRSPERLLDEVTLFLHQVEAKLPPERQRMLREARHREEALDGRRILVVEDDVRNVFALSSVLEPKGAKLGIARNGREALAALADQTKDGTAYDLVLMDIMMPEMDGYAAMREIRKQPQFKRLPIIALTAKAMRDDQEKCLAAGANDYIAKPLDVEKLLSLVRVWLPK